MGRIKQKAVRSMQYEEERKKQALSSRQQAEDGKQKAESGLRTFFLSTKDCLMTQGF